MLRRLFILVLCICASLQGAALAQNPLDPVAVAVLNFANRGQGDAQWDWLGKGLADLMIGDIASQQLKVVSREQMQALLQELELKHAATDPEIIARVLKVTRCVHGTYLVTGQKVEINAVLIDASSGEELHSAAVAGPVKTVLQLEKRLAAELIDILQGTRVGTLAPGALPQWTESISASQLLYEGVDFFDHGQYLEAWTNFRRARRRDQDYADAIYWSARMMYYLDKYHHARIDLENFARKYPRHPRVGDAVMEIINSAQLTASSAEDVLRVLQMAMDLSPEAEVPNQFGAGLSSNVATYAAGLAVQIYKADGKFDLGFQYIVKALKHAPRESLLYKVTYPEALYLAVKHAEKTGVVLPLPPKPDPAPSEREQIQQQSPGINLFGGPLLETAGKHLFHRKLIALAPNGSVVRVTPGTEAWQAVDCTRYFCAPPGWRIQSLEFEFRYNPYPEWRPNFTISKGNFNQERSDEPGLAKIRVTPVPGQRVLPAQVDLPAEVRSYEVRADLVADDAALGTLVIKPPAAFACALKYDGLTLPLLTDTLRLTHVPQGSHTLEFKPHVWGESGVKTAQVRVADRQKVVIELEGHADPIRRLEDASGRYYPKTISSPYDYFRMGADMGDHPGLLASEVGCFHDRKGRLIVLWTMRRDLYMVTSSDGGNSWTKTEKLPPPVNTAHDERVPVLLHDRSGRYVLAFISDRNLEHAPCTYVCWSEDLKTFSAPYRLTNEISMPVGIVEAPPTGDLVYMLLPKERLRSPQSDLDGFFRSDRWVVSASADLARWTQSRDILEIRTIDYRTFLDPHAAAKIKQPILQKFPPSSAAFVEREGQILAMTGYPGGSMGWEVSHDGLMFRPVVPPPKLPPPNVRTYHECAAELRFQHSARIGLPPPARSSCQSSRSLGTRQLSSVGGISLCEVSPPCNCPAQAARLRRDRRVPFGLMVSLRLHCARVQFCASFGSNRSAMDAAAFCRAVLPAICSVKSSATEV